MSVYGPKTRGATYMRGRNIMYVNGQQTLDVKSRLWFDLYASMTYMRIYMVYRMPLYES